MSRLEEDKANSSSQIADAQAETEKREERLRAMSTKVRLKQFAVQLILSHFGLYLFTALLQPWQTSLHARNVSWSVANLLGNYSQLRLVWRQPK